MDLNTIISPEARMAAMYWGSEKQTCTTIEEIGEFLAAWNQFRRGRITYEEYVEEIVDVYIMLQQMILLHEKKFLEVYNKKIVRLRNKLIREKYGRGEGDYEVS